MSTINKKAFISKVLESLTSEQLTTLKGLVNGSTEPTFKSLINSTYGITNSDKGVKHIILETEEKTLSGYLIYNNTYCMMITYALNTQELSMFHILLNEQKVKAVSEYLDIDELRTLLDDSLIDGKVEALSSTGLKREVVTALPTEGIQTNVIYLVPAQDTSTGNIYEEYMYINDAWELIGSSATSGGSGVEVVELTGGSGTLSDADYAKVSGDNCIIKLPYGSTDYIYVLYSKSDSTIVYQVPIETSSFTQYSANITFWQRTITITVSTKGWVYAENLNSLAKVAANPTLAGTEADLTSIQVGGNTYKVGLSVVGYGSTLTQGEVNLLINRQAVLAYGSSASDISYYYYIGKDSTYYYLASLDPTSLGVKAKYAKITISGRGVQMSDVTVRDDGVNYLTTAPSAANTSGRLKFVVLSSEPATKYDGYLYIITGA